MLIGEDVLGGNMPIEDDILDLPCMVFLVGLAVALIAWKASRDNRSW